MNYIKQLQEENKRLKQEKNKMIEKIIAFRSHLMIQKFWDDPNINTSDVDNRLCDILSVQ